MQMNAQLRSIPEGPAFKKTALFTQGALKSMQFAPRGHGYYDAFVQQPDSAVVSVSCGPATIIKGHSSDSMSGHTFTTCNHAHPVTGTVMPYTGNARLIIFNPGASDHIIAKEYYVIGGDSPCVKERYITAVQYTSLGPAATNAHRESAHTGGQVMELARAAGEIDGVTAEPNYGPTSFYDSMGYGTAMGRTGSIPLWGSARSCNITESLAVGWLVRVLRYNGSIKLFSYSARQSPCIAELVSACEMIRDSDRTKTWSGHELTAVH